MNGSIRKSIQIKIKEKEEKQKQDFYSIYFND